MSKSVKVYCCGGAGVNIGRKLESQGAFGRRQPGFAQIDAVYVDSSKSNMLDKVDDPNVYTLTRDDGKKTDGAGKDRSSIAEVAAKAVPEILHLHRPGDLNVVLHSGSGGSGSASGPFLAKELVSNGHPTIVIMIGSTTSEKEIDNAIKTVMTYQHFSQSIERPISCIWFANDKGGQNVVNDLVMVNLLLLAAVWSGENHGLDSQDLKNFLDYRAVTSHRPALTGLVITNGREQFEVEKGRVVSTIVSVIKEGEEPDPGVAVAYHSYGQLSPAAAAAIQQPTPIHLHTVQGFFTSIVAGLQAKQKEIQELYKVHVINDVKIDSATVHGSGLVV